MRPTRLLIHQTKGSPMRSITLIRGALFVACIASFATAAEPPQGFTALFNGQDLSGWHGWAIHEKGAGPVDLPTQPAISDLLRRWDEDAKKHWRVENGELVNDGHGAYLATDKAYGDVEFFIE